MPNTGGHVVTPADVADKIGHLKDKSYVDFGLHVLLSDSSPFMAEFAKLGVVGLKWMLGYGAELQPTTPLTLRDALAAAAEHDMLIGVHAEDHNWITYLERELVSLGRTDIAAHGESRPPFVEALGVAYACTLAREFGPRLHIHHVTSFEALNALRSTRSLDAKRLTVETCPHYLYLTAQDADAMGPRARVNPPLRSNADRNALWKAIDDGVIDVIASDHAPHAIDEKRVDSVWSAKSGLLGVETIFPLLFDEVVAGRLPIQRFIELTAEQPASIARLSDRKGSLLPGRDADILVVDPTAQTRIDATHLHSKHRDTPFEGWTRRGSIKRVFLRGRPLIHEGQLVAGQRQGRFVPSLH
jgi:dihydroorotase (multifunctional complex type)